MARSNLVTVLILKLRHESLRKVAAAGGFPAYEKAHRQALDALAAKAFLRLPTEVAAHVVSFAFHVGYY